MKNAWHFQESVFQAAFPPLCFSFSSRVRVLFGPVPLRGSFGRHLCTGIDRIPGKSSGQTAAEENYAVYIQLLKAVSTATNEIAVSNEIWTRGGLV